MILGSPFGHGNVGAPAPTLRAHQVRNLDDRVDVLRALVWSPRGGLRDPDMRRIGLAVTRACAARSDDCELRAVFDFIVKNVRYTGDITTKDTFQTALRTLQFAGGDCDDMAILVATLVMENGFTPRWRITSNTGATWDHIFTLVGTPKHKPARWTVLDTTLGVGRFGDAPRSVKHRDFHVVKEE